VLWSQSLSQKVEGSGSSALTCGKQQGDAGRAWCQGNTAVGCVLHWAVLRCCAGWPVGSSICCTSSMPARLINYPAGCLATRSTLSTCRWHANQCVCLFPLPARVTGDMDLCTDVLHTKRFLAASSLVAPATRSDGILVVAACIQEARTSGQARNNASGE
jgi:hypothetical protein